MTVWEAIYMHCCATLRIPYLTNGQTFSNEWNMFLFCIVAIWVPVYREFHFYFSHRYVPNYVNKLSEKKRNLNDNNENLKF